MKFEEVLVEYKKGKKIFRKIWDKGNFAYPLGIMDGIKISDLTETDWEVIN